MWYDQDEAFQMMLANEKRVSKEEGQKKGLIQGTIETCQELGQSIAEACVLLCGKFDLTNEESEKHVDMYWRK